MNASERTSKEKSREAQIETTPQIATILDYLSDYGEITAKEAESSGSETNPCICYKKQMIDAGLLKAIGRGENKKYIVVK